MHTHPLSLSLTHTYKVWHDHTRLTGVAGLAGGFRVVGFNSIQTPTPIPQILQTTERKRERERANRNLSKVSEFLNIYMFKNPVCYLSYL